MAKGDKRPVVMQSDRGVANGIATLDENGKLAQMPTPTDIGTVSDTRIRKMVDTSGWYRIGTIPNWGAWRFVFGGGWNTARQNVIIVDLAQNYTAFDAAQILYASKVTGVTQIRAVSIGSGNCAIDVYFSPTQIEYLEVSCVSYWNELAFIPAETIELITDEVTPTFTLAFT